MLCRCGRNSEEPCKSATAGCTVCMFNVIHSRERDEISGNHVHAEDASDTCMQTWAWKQRARDPSRVAASPAARAVRLHSPFDEVRPTRCFRSCGAWFGTMHAVHAVYPHHARHPPVWLRWW